MLDSGNTLLTCDVDARGKVHVGHGHGQRRIN